MNEPVIFKFKWKISVRSLTLSKSEQLNYLIDAQKAKKSKSTQSPPFDFTPVAAAQHTNRTYNKQSIMIEEKYRN